MALSKASSRTLWHQRDVSCRGYLRDDGMWDIEGQMLDRKTYPFDNSHRGTVKAGDAVHKMQVRLTVDDEYVVRDAEAVTIAAPFAMCGNVTPNFKLLIGEKIKPGWTQRTRQLLGGVKGCTHLVELLGPVATTAFQTIRPGRKLARHSKKPAAKERKPKTRPRILDTCHAFASDGQIVKAEMPQFYTGDEAAD